MHRYNPVDATFAITLEHRGVVTDCVIQTMTTDPPIEFRSGGLPNANPSTRFQSCVTKAILRSEDLRDAMSEMEWLGGATVTIAVNGLDGDWTMAISSTGDCGRGVVEFSSTSDSFLSFDCRANADIGASYTYSLTSLSRTMQALKVSSETLLRIDDWGLLSLQLAIQGSEGLEPNFVDFLICPLADDVGTQSGGTTQASTSEDSGF